MPKGTACRSVSLLQIGPRKKCRSSNGIRTERPVLRQANVHLTAGPAPFRHPAWRTEQGGTARDQDARRPTCEDQSKILQTRATEGCRWLNRPRRRVIGAAASRSPPHSHRLALHRLRLRPAPRVRRRDGVVGRPVERALAEPLATAGRREEVERDALRRRPLAVHGRIDHEGRGASVLHSCAG